MDFPLLDAGMKSRGIGIALIVVGTAGLIWFWLGAADKRKSSPAPLPVRPAKPLVLPAGAAGAAADKSLHSAATLLGAAQTAEERNYALALLRNALSSGSTNEISAAIRKLLDAKTDAVTGLGFKLGGGGALLEAPTLRTWLLEELAKLDPAAAAAYALTILNSSASPDEWALALRNLARGDTGAEARALLEAKTNELLRNESWQRDPSVGYLEAFDTAVHLGGTTLLPPLAELVSKKDNQAVAHAAFLTLDRLVINAPAPTLAALNEHPGWMIGREETRANYFARADVGDTAQRTLVEDYLLDPARSPAELRNFSGVFPNANFMISHNLLTETRTLDGTTLRQRDLVALAVVTQWLSDPSFGKLRDPLTQIQRRLKEFTKQADETKTGN